MSKGYVANLIPFNRMSEEEHKAKSSKGGRNAGETKRRRKAMREQMDLLLALEFNGKQRKEFATILGIPEEHIDNQMALMVSLFCSALKGNLDAFDKIRDIIGDNKEITQQDRVQIINDLPNEEDKP